MSLSLCVFSTWFLQPGGIKVDRLPWKQEAREAPRAHGVRRHSFSRLTLHLHDPANEGLFTFCALATLLPLFSPSPVYMSHSIPSTLYSSQQLKAHPEEGEGLERKELHLDRNSASLQRVFWRCAKLCTFPIL